MPFRRRNSMALRPIHRIKHIIDQSSTLAKATALNVVLIQAKDAPTLAVETAVETGAKVNGIYLRFEVASNETVVGAIPNVYLAVWKSPGDNVGLGSIANLGDDDNKRFVIHQEMIMLNNLKGGTPRTLFNGVIVIPKGMRRFAPNDILYATIVSPSTNIVECLQCHYKEFR